MVAVPQQQIQLQFQPAHGLVHQDLSAVRWVADDFLWLGSDETATLERLTLAGNTAGDHQHIALSDYLELPHPLAQEVDVEGIAYSDHYLWIVGSHGLKRKRVNLDVCDTENIKRLATLKREANRYLLARIPLVQGQLFKRCSHPERPEITLTAAQLPFKKKSGNQLTKVLEADPHLGAFLQAEIPGKDNGFDIEGIAVWPGDANGKDTTRVFVGLRGPVLRGWAILLELQIGEDKGDLKLNKIGPGKTRYLKHFVNLQGLGIRDLCPFDGNLLILAGPTMDLAASVKLFCLQDMAQLPADQLHYPSAVLDLPYGQGYDKAEGITRLPNGELLVVYDSPGSDRVNNAMTAVLADVFSIDPI